MPPCLLEGQRYQPLHTSAVSAEVFEQLPRRATRVLSRQQPHRLWVREHSIRAAWLLGTDLREVLTLSLLQDRSLRVQYRVEQHRGAQWLASPCTCEGYTYQREERFVSELLETP